MKGGSLRSQQRYTRFNECGQAMVFIVLALSLFLLAAVGFAVDIANLWFHRQVAQNAADAACTAGAMDLLVSAQGTSLGGFTPGTAFTCSSTPGAAPCQYAAMNGYNGTGLVAGSASNDVAVSFPSAGSNPAPGVTPPSSSTAPVPFIRVDVIERVRVFLIGLLSGAKTQDVRAFAVCGLVAPGSPLPIIVLNPSVASSLNVSANAVVTIIGGPQRSIQVNSNSSSAVSITSNAQIDLCYSGAQFCGGDLGVWGQQPQPSSSRYITSCPPPNPPPNPPTCQGTQVTPRWSAPAIPISDPFASLPAPTVPATPSPPPGCSTNPCQVNYHVNGCPDTNKCWEYAPGLYTSPISVGSNDTAIFDPGLYYIKPTSGGQPDLSFSGNSVIRPSNVGDGTGGTMFYLSGPAGNIGSINISGNSGLRAVDPFYTAGGGPANNPAIICPGGQAPNPPLPATVNFNVLLGVCSGTYGDPSGLNRGMAIFADRSNSGTNWYSQPNLGGNGALLFTGNLYFHNCVGSPCTGYNQDLTITGNGSSSTAVVGELVTDQLSVNGNGTINMQLFPTSGFGVLKAGLLR